MSIYVLVEGNEKAIYKKWISFLLPNYTNVSTLENFSENKFIIISGYGFPQILNRIQNAIKDVNRHNISYLLICVDADDEEVELRRGKVNDFIMEECDDTEATIFVVVQNCCIESWLMGNKRLNMNHATDADLMKYRDFYNVNIEDPELLPPYDERTKAIFTYDYFRLMMKNKKSCYTKRTLNRVSTKSFLKQLMKRFDESNHIQSFGYFISKIKDINAVDD